MIRPHRAVHVRIALAAAVLLVLSNLATLSWPAHARQADPEPAIGAPQATSVNLYLPLMMRQIAPSLGMITTPAELKAAKALADQGQEPSRSAVIVLMRTVEDALEMAPCAVANYTTDVGVDCLNESSQYAFVLALAYRMTDNPLYGQRAAAFIRIWYATLVTIDRDDSQTQLDWSRMAPAMIWAADLLGGTPVWTDVDRQAFSAMLVDKVLVQGQEASKRRNNWADAGNMLRLTIAVYARLPDERAAVIANWKQKLDGMQQAANTWSYGMLPDGSLAEENRRGEDGLAYNQGALSSKTVFAEILRRQGDSSLFSYKTPRGVGLKDGWDFLAQYVVDASKGQNTWPYTADHYVEYSNKSGWEIAYAYWREPAYLGPIELERPYQWGDWADPGYSTLLFGNLNLSGK